MPPRSAAAYVFDVVQACTRIVEYTKESSPDSFVADRRTRDAVERQLAIAAEAVTRLRQASPETARRLGPADRIAGFRNILVHAYFQVDPHEVFSIAVHHVPALLAAAQAVLRSMPPPELTPPP